MFNNKIKLLLKDASVPVRYPRYDLESDSNLHGGVWKPWRLTKDELENQNKTTAEINEHLDVSNKRFSFIERTVRLRETFKNKLDIMRQQFHEAKFVLKSAKQVNSTLYDYDIDFRAEIEQLQNEYADEAKLLSTMRHARKLARQMAKETNKQKELEKQAAVKRMQVDSRSNSKIRKCKLCRKKGK